MNRGFPDWPINKDISMGKREPCYVIYKENGFKYAYTCCKEDWTLLFQIFFSFPSLLIVFKFLMYFNLFFPIFYVYLLIL